MSKDPWESTVRAALDAIQHPRADGDMQATAGSEAHGAWLLRIDAIEAVLRRVVQRNAEADVRDTVVRVNRREAVRG